MCNSGALGTFSLAIRSFCGVEGRNCTADAQLTLEGQTVTGSDSQIHVEIVNANPDGMDGGATSARFFNRAARP